MKPNTKAKIKLLRPKQTKVQNNQMLQTKSPKHQKPQTKSPKQRHMSMAIHTHHIIDDI